MFPPQLCQAVPGQFQLFDQRLTRLLDERMQHDQELSVLGQQHARDPDL